MKPLLLHPTSRRIAAVWLRSFSIDIFDNQRLKNKKSFFVLFQDEGGRNRILAASAAAQSVGLAPGHALADAQALYPNLAAYRADPLRDRQAAERLADWCARYTPWASLDANVGPGEAGLLLDVTGSTHLLGGEAGFLADVKRRLVRFGLEARLSLAQTPGAAWAWARFRPAGAAPILAAGAAPAALRALPVEALRLPPDMAETLRRLGLRRIADIVNLPRAALAARFGAELLRRLDQARGDVPEPIAPRKPPADYAAGCDFVEPVMVPAALPAVLARLLPRLCRQLEGDGRGARRLVFSLYRIDGSTAAATVGTSAPVRDPAHLAKLFAPGLETLDPDPGIESARLEAVETAPLAGDQGCWIPGARPQASAALDRLIDRIASRLGGDRIGYLAPQPLHLPERQCRFVPALAGAPPDWSAWPAAATPQPLRLLAAPEPIDLQEPGAGGEAPPRAFLWRRRIHRTARAAGPDRRLGAWWQGETAARDYWAILDRDGWHLWLFRDLHTGRWHVHGILAPARAAAAGLERRP